MGSVRDHLFLKRIQADLFQPEMALKVGVSVRKVQAWEHDKIIPTADEWQILTSILLMDSAFPKC